MNTDLKKGILCLGILLLSQVVLKAQTLESYLQIAVENNPELEAAYTDFEAAMLEIPQVKALPDPTFSVSAFGTMLETRLGPQEARFSLMQMFPWFGTLEARAEVAHLKAQAAFQDYLESRSSLLLEVKKAYYELYEVEKMLQFQTENKQVLQDYKDLALVQVSSGTGALTDVLQADIQKNDAQAEIEILELRKEAALASFNLLLNRELLAAVVIPENLDAEIELNEELEAEFENHPRIRKYGLLSEASAASMEVIEKEGMPTFGLGVDYVIVGNRHDMMVEDSGRDAIMPMLSLNLPIFRKKYRAAKKQAGLAQESYSLLKLSERNEMEVEFKTAVYAMKKAAVEILLTQKQLSSTQQVLDLLLSSYRNGQSEFAEVLAGGQELLEYQFSLASATADYLKARSIIEYLSEKSTEDENFTK